MEFQLGLRSSPDRFIFVMPVLKGRKGDKKLVFSVIGVTYNAKRQSNKTTWKQTWTEESFTKEMATLRHAGWRILE